MLIFAVSCRAQDPIISLSSDENIEIVTGNYYKDVDNSFFPFLGEWQFDNGFHFFKIKLKKITRYRKQYQANYYFEDLVIGEYIFKENNIEKVNTLNTLDDVAVSPYRHNIVGNIIKYKDNFPLCNECAINEKRLSLIFNDPTREISGLLANIELRRVDENGIQKLKMILRQTGNLELENGMMPEYTSFNLPWGTYILTRP